MGTVQMLKSVGAIDIAAEPTDLIAAAARGDLGAFERLYRQFSPRVYGLCLRLTGQREAAEDCTQESFVAAWRALGGFEQRRRFTTWLHRIAVHTVLARRRGLRVEYEVPEPATGLPEVAAPMAAQAAAFEEPRNPGYVAARAELEVSFRERVALLDPATRAKIEASLAVIRRAHEDIRKALASDPASPVLEQLWQSTSRDELDLYEHVVRATQPTMTRT